MNEDYSGFVTWLAERDLEDYFSHAFETCNEHTKECENCREFTIQDETRECITMLLRHAEPTEIAVIAVAFNSIVKKYEAYEAEQLEQADKAFMEFLNRPEIKADIEARVTDFIEKFKVQDILNG